MQCLLHWAQGYCAFACVHGLRRLQGPGRCALHTSIPPHTHTQHTHLVQRIQPFPPQHGCMHSLCHPCTLFTRCVALHACLLHLLACRCVWSCRPRPGGWSRWWRVPRLRRRMRSCWTNRVVAGPPWRRRWTSWWRQQVRGLAGTCRAAACFSMPQSGMACMPRQALCRPLGRQHHPLSGRHLPQPLGCNIVPSLSRPAPSWPAPCRPARPLVPSGALRRAGGAHLWAVQLLPGGPGAHCGHGAAGQGNGGGGPPNGGRWAAAV